MKYATTRMKSIARWIREVRKPRWPLYVIRDALNEKRVMDRRWTSRDVETVLVSTGGDPGVELYALR